jgi:hypothetical protein
MQFTDTETTSDASSLCQECRFDPTSIRHEEAAELIAINESAWRRLLTTRHPSRLSELRASGAPSPLQHACRLWRASHDFALALCALLPHGVAGNLDRVQPPMPDVSNEQDPWIVAKGIEVSTTVIAAHFQELTLRQWEKTVLWEDSCQTIGNHAGRLLHEMIHRQHLVITSILDRGDSPAEAPRGYAT